MGHIKQAFADIGIHCSTSTTNRTECKNDKEDNIEIEMEELVPVDQILSEVGVKSFSRCTGATRK